VKSVIFQSQCLWVYNCGWYVFLGYSSQDPEHPDGLDMYSGMDMYGGKGGVVRSSISSSILGKEGKGKASNYFWIGIILVRQ